MTDWQRRPIVQLPTDVTHDGAVSLAGYCSAVRGTDKLPPDDLTTPIHGLFGEIGSLLAVIKKQRRDATACATYNAALSEELGDALWYFTCIAYRAGLDLPLLCRRAVRGVGDRNEPEADSFGTWSDVQRAHPQGGRAEISMCVSALAELAGQLVGDLRTRRIPADGGRLSDDLVAILGALLSTVEAAGIDLDLAARGNLAKTFSRWPINRIYPILIDADMPHNERLPRRFEMFIEEHAVNGKIYVIQKRNGVIVGDRLTDNRTEEDDYRFHDVFHIAYAVHLGWSPVLRSLFHTKRKSAPRIDESEDGARAVLIEEGISTVVFGRAVERNLFEGLEQLDFDLLKLVREFTRGFEPERCALWQWERAILDGFKMFREMKKHRRGYVRADLEAHTLDFRPGAEADD